jgi:hypothetical protein
MSEKNIPQQNPRITLAASVRRFGASEAALMMSNVKAARSILRTVILALEAIDDGSASFDGGTERWEPAVSEACTRLCAVRSVLIESASPPNLDWFTPLNLVEALDAALWHGHSCSRGEQLSSEEVIFAAQVVIDSLDTLTQEFEGLNIVKMAEGRPMAAAH